MGIFEPILNLGPDRKGELIRRVLFLLQKCAEGRRFAAPRDYSPLDLTLLL